MKLLLFLSAAWKSAKEARSHSSTLIALLPEVSTAVNAARICMAVGIARTAVAPSAMRKIAAIQTQRKRYMAKLGSGFPRILPKQVVLLVKLRAGRGRLRGQVLTGSFGHHGLTGSGGDEAEAPAERVGADRLQCRNECCCARVGLRCRGQQRLGGGEKTDQRETRKSEAGFDGRVFI